jgi:hypothetical protein
MPRRRIRELCPTHALPSCALHTCVRFDRQVLAFANGMLREPLNGRNALTEEQSWRTQPSARTRRAPARHRSDRRIAATPVNTLQPADRRARKPCASADTPVVAASMPGQKNETPHRRRFVMLASG